MKRTEYCWFDVQIEQRVATMRGNFFVGENLGNNIYKIGFMCLIGIAHLPERLKNVRYATQAEIRPFFSTDIGKEVDKELSKYAPLICQPIIANLTHSLKLITAKILPQLPVGGNVPFDDIWDEIEEIMHAEPPIMQQVQSEDEQD